MRIISAEVTNFASYKKLHFIFKNQGLTLISGPTGAGKSTLCDIIPWILFGKTAKNGTVDEIRSWHTDESTDGTLVFSQGDQTYYVRRIRGKSNDLFYGQQTDYIAEGKRGKDATDTQKKINQLIGLDVDTYLAGAYFHEFSQTAQFFTTTAKVRRSITEQLADLTLAKQLQENSSSYNKEIKKEHESVSQEILLKKNTLASLQRTLKDTTARWNAHELHHAASIKDLEDKAKNYEALKAKEIKILQGKHKVFEKDREDKSADILLETESYTKMLKPANYYEFRRLDLDIAIAALRHSKCKECGAPKNIDSLLVKEKELYGLNRDEASNKAILTDIGKLEVRLSNIKNQVNPYTRQIEQEKSRQNTYLRQLEEIKQSINPFETVIDETAEAMIITKEEIKALDAKSKDLTAESDDMESLADVINTFRSAIISRTVSYLETSTNDLLSSHFDAEIRVTFSASDADKLEVEITKDGNLCSYTQLSKGQRQLLKLCFGVSVMKAISNYNSTDFNCLWFDEVFSGLDEELKAKGFGLLEELARNYSSLFVIDHSTELKAMFINEIKIRLEDGNSTIGGDNE